MSRLRHLKRRHLTIGLYFGHELLEHLNQGVEPGEITILAIALHPRISMGEANPFPNRLRLAEVDHPDPSLAGAVHKKQTASNHLMDGTNGRDK